MTREVRYPEGGKVRVPEYVDHGHLARKAAYWAAVWLVAPVAVIAVAASTLGEFLESFFGGHMGRLREWSHPCLYARRSESTEDYLKRVGYR